MRLLLLPIVLCVGCGSPQPAQTFRVVDGPSGRPLAGVSSEGQNRVDDILWGSRASDLHLPPSGGDGLIKAPKVPRGWNQRLHFQKTGYLDAHAWRDAEGKVLISRPPSDPFHSRSARAIDVREVIEIPMYPEGTPAAALDPRWRAVTEVPSRVLETAELTSRRVIKPGQPKPWRMEAGALQLFASAYGDYRVLWVAQRPVGDEYPWEWIEVGSHGRVVRIKSGWLPAVGGAPRAEALGLLEE